MLKRIVLAAAILTILPITAIAQTAPKRPAAPTKEVAAVPPATLDDLFYSSQRTNKLLAGIKEDIAAIRAAGGVAGQARKGAVFIDFGTVNALQVEPAGADKTTIRWCRSINYASGKIVYQANDGLIVKIVCYD